MKIAVTSQNFRTVTPHAGRTRRFVVYEAAEDGGEPVEVNRLDLPKEMSMHEFHGQGPHPLDAVDVIIAGSCGEGFAARMKTRGIIVVATELTDPVEAVKEYLARRQTESDVPPGVVCGCEHGRRHAHQHAHAHRHRHGPAHGSSARAGLHWGYRVPGTAGAEEKTSE